MTNDRNEKNEKLAEDRALLSQQNKEYAESLAKDLAKKEEKEKLRIAAEERNQRKKTIQEYKEKIQGTMYNGPHRVLVRYPSGCRAIVGFSPSDPISALFDAIMSNHACPDYFSVRSVYPKSEIQCFPDWYRTIFNAEFPDDEDVKKTDMAAPLKTLESIPNNSILFVNMIH